MAQHAARVRLPGLGVALALGHVLGGADRVATVFPVDLAGAFGAFLIHREVHAIEGWVLVDDAGPAVHPDHRHDAVVLVGEGIEFLGERVELVLIGNDQQCHHLRVVHLTLETGLLEGAGDFFGGGAHLVALGELIQQRGECSSHVNLNRRYRCGGRRQRRSA
ncbi:hypothetical protein D9M69_609370 [compost metagenome]